MFRYFRVEFDDILSGQFIKIYVYFSYFETVLVVGKENKEPASTCNTNFSSIIYS